MYIFAEPIMHNMNNLRPQWGVCEAHLPQACNTLGVIPETMAKMPLSYTRSKINEDLHDGVGISLGTVVGGLKV